MVFGDVTLVVQKSPNRKHVSFNGVDSGWDELTCEVPQGSVLGPLLFLICVNDLPNRLKLLQVIFFANDITVYVSPESLPHLIKTIKQELVILSDWFKSNKL